MKYNVGDKVWVRNDLEAGSMIAGFIITDNMVKLKGQQVTIWNAREGYACYNIIEDTHKSNWPEAALLERKNDSVPATYEEMQAIIHDEGKVLVDEEYLEALENDSLKLTALENAGVDNWDGYDIAMELLAEMKGESEDE